AAAPADDAHAKWKIIENYCFDCHNTQEWAGKVAFDAMSPDQIGQDGQVWEAAIKKLKGGMMPPPGKNQPGKEATAQLISWLETSLDKARPRPYVGDIPLRRLNRREYANSIRELIGLDIDPATYLPGDTLVDGFDTNAESLRFTPAFLDQAVSSAR